MFNSTGSNWQPFYFRSKLLHFISVIPSYDTFMVRKIPNLLLWCTESVFSHVTTPLMTPSWSLSVVYSSVWTSLWRSWARFSTTYQRIWLYACLLGASLCSANREQQEVTSVQNQPSNRIEYVVGKYVYARIRYLNVPFWCNFPFV